MNLREKQTEQTRLTILDAASDLLFSDAHPSSITMQAVADKAGVSHRTLYRHFASRQALTTAMGERLDDSMEKETGIANPDSFEAWIGGIESAMKFGAANRENFRRFITVGVGGGVYRRDRDARYWGMFRQRFPHLDEATARQDFAALRHLMSAANVVLIGERFELSPEELVGALQRASEAMIAGVERRDQEAARA